MTLDELETGKDAIISHVNSDNYSIWKHILDMGLTPGIEVTVIKAAPISNNMKLRARGHDIKIKKSDVAKITISFDYGNPFAIREYREELIDGNRGIYYYYYWGLGEEQKHYSICIPMCNSYNMNNKKCEISVDEFEKNIKYIFEEKFIPKIKKMTWEDITFNSMFKGKEKLPLNENQIIYFIYYFSKFIIYYILIVQYHQKI